eukprot:7875447-Alexandrium_andersonii.AAC.1
MSAFGSDTPKSTILAGDIPWLSKMGRASTLVGEPKKRLAKRKGKAVAGLGSALKAPTSELTR